MQKIDNIHPRLLQIAKYHLASGNKPIPLRYIPEEDFRFFAINQRRTVIHEGKVALEISEFLRIAAAIQSNVC